MSTTKLVMPLQRANKNCRRSSLNNKDLKWSCMGGLRITAHRTEVIWQNTSRVNSPWIFKHDQKCFKFQMIKHIGHPTNVLGLNFASVSSSNYPIQPHLQPFSLTLLCVLFKSRWGTALGGCLMPKRHRIRPETGLPHVQCLQKQCFKVHPCNAQHSKET